MHRKTFALLAAALFLGSSLSVVALTPSTSPATDTRLIPIAHAAAVDYFLKIEGVDGESTDDKHKGEIEIESFSWGVSQGAQASGGGGGVGKASFQDLHLNARVNKASPQLMLAVATGEHFKNAVLVARKAGQTQVEFYTVKLSDVLISSYQSNGDAGSVPMDQFSLNFSRIEFEYFPQRADGTLGSPSRAGYDLKTNKKI